MAPAGPEFELVKFKFQFILVFSRSLVQDCGCPPRLQTTLYLPPLVSFESVYKPFLPHGPVCAFHVWLSRF